MSHDRPGVRTVAGERIDFNSLPRSARERLVRSLTAPILADTDATGDDRAGALGNAVLAIFGAGALLCTAAARIDDPWKLACAGGGAFAIVFGIAGLVRRPLARRALPWPPGRYLMPYGYVEAYSGALRYIPASRITVRTATEPRGDQFDHLVELVVDGRVAERFRIVGRMDSLPAEQIAAIPSYSGPALADDPPGDGDRGGPRAAVVPFLLRHRWLPSSAAGALACIALRAWLLPVAAVEHARMIGTVDAWRETRKAYPQAWVRAEADAAIRARYDAVRKTVRDRAKPAARDFLLALIDHAQKSGEPGVRVVNEPVSALPILSGKALLDAAGDAPGTTVASLQAAYECVREPVHIPFAIALRQLIPPDVLDPDVRAPENAPEVVINRSWNATRALYRNDRGRVYLGIAHRIHLRWRLGERTFEFTIAIDPPVDPTIWREAEGGGDDDARVYRQIHERAMGEFKDAVLRELVER